MARNGFTKSWADAPRDFFASEAAGLAWLAETGTVRIATVIEVTGHAIELERIAESSPTSSAARGFGRDLARMHDAGARAFGARPDGWAGTEYIGRRSMPSADEKTWGRFYARDRVLPFLSIAEQAGNLSSSARGTVEAACEVIARGRFDDADGPARLHGDLWSGNVLWSASGVVLIDPAAHGGHRETDLAMLALFGCPYLDEVIAGYQEQHELQAGWRDRIPLHQLHPLAVHAAGHGPSYGRALETAAERVLELA